MEVEEAKWPSEFAQVAVTKAEPNPCCPTFAVNPFSICFQVLSEICKFGQSHSSDCNSSEKFI